MMALVNWTSRRLAALWVIGATVELALVVAGAASQRRADDAFTRQWGLDRPLSPNAAHLSPATRDSLLATLAQNGVYVHMKGDTIAGVRLRADLDTAASRTIDRLVAALSEGYAFAVLVLAAIFLPIPLALLVV